MYRRILVPTDGSRVSARAEETAIGMAKRFKASITAVHVIVMGSNSRAGIQRIFLGSVAAEVLAATDIPTLICR